MSDYYDLGSYSRRITTDAPGAQRWFDRGLTWLYGYNHDEAVKCFRKALDQDPHCVMAYWGVAYGLGCNYNKQWEAFAPKALALALRQGRAAILEACAYLDRATAVETALLKALEKRFQRDDETDVEVLVTWNDEFAAAMRDVYRAFPDDWDVAALFAEAIMNRTSLAIVGFGNRRTGGRGRYARSDCGSRKSAGPSRSVRGASSSGIAASVHPFAGNVAPAGTGYAGR